MEKRIQVGIPSSPGSIFMTLLLMVFMAGISVMLVLPHLPPTPLGVAAGLGTPVLLTLGCVPFLWYLVLDPLRRAREGDSSHVLGVFGTLTDAVVGCDRSGNILYLNRAGQQMFGYEQDVPKGRNLAVLFPVLEGKTRVTTRDFFDVLARKNAPTELTGKCRDGQTFQAEVTFSSGGVGGAWFWTCVIRNLHARRETETQLVECQQQLEYLAYHDPLTQLPNRHLFQKRLQVAVTEAKSGKGHLAVVFLDMDHFQNINDSLGKEIGDQVLVQIARRLLDTVRGHDSVARFGGDQFVMILNQVQDIPNIAVVAQRLQQNLAKVIPLAGHRLYLHSSIGISVFPEDGEDPATLLNNAETAMYRAKGRGGAGLHFSQAEMNIRARDRLLLENHLRKAVERQEISLHYQPQFNLISGELIGMEALCRWLHPHRGPIPPAGFIPIAEENGLIISLGDWVLREGCLQLKRWLNEGHPKMRLAVNVSPRQFQQANFAEKVKNILAETGLPGDALELEVTESIIAKDVESARQVMNQLNELGVHWAVDDFGSGYSSLDTLRRLPIDRLQIDRAFVLGIPDDLEQARMAEAIIALAHKMNFGVLAEGIENLEQSTFLRRHGCDAGQGYLFGRPVPAEDFEKFLPALPIRQGRLEVQVLQA